MRRGSRWRGGWRRRPARRAGRARRRAPRGGGAAPGRSRRPSAPRRARRRAARGGDRPRRAGRAGRAGSRGPPNPARARRPLGSATVPVTGRVRSRRSSFVRSPTGIAARGPARALRADLAQHRRHGAQALEVEPVERVGIDGRVEHQPRDAVGMRAGVGERRDGPVADAAEHQAVDAELRAQLLEVLDGGAGAHERAAGAEPVRAVRDALACGARAGRRRPGRPRCRGSRARVGARAARVEQDEVVPTGGVADQARRGVAAPGHEARLAGAVGQRARTRRGAARGPPRRWTRRSSVPATAPVRSSGTVSVPQAMPGALRARREAPAAAYADDAPIAVARAQEKAEASRISPPVHRRRIDRGSRGGAAAAGAGSGLHRRFRLPSALHGGVPARRRRRRHVHRPRGGRIGRRRLRQGAVDAGRPVARRGRGGRRVGPRPGRAGRLRARHDRGDERAAGAPRRADGAGHDRGLPRRARDRPPDPRRPLRPLGPPPGPAGAARAPLHGARALRARRACCSRSTTRASTAAVDAVRDVRRRGGRRQPPLRLPAPRARAGRRRRAGGRAARRADRALAPRAARLPRVRAHRHDGRVGVPRAAARRLPAARWASGRRRPGCPRRW